MIFVKSLWHALAQVYHQENLYRAFWCSPTRGRVYANILEEIQCGDAQGGRID